MTTDDDRIGYLAGEPGPELDPPEAEELDDLRALLSDRAMWAEPERGLEDRVVAAIATEAGGGTVVGPVRRRRGRGALIGAVAAVAAAAAAVVVVVAVVSSGGGSGSAQLAASLRPTALAPKAEGHASLTRTDAGWRIELDATGLPRLSGERFYQGWLRNTAGELVPIGTFNAPDGVVLWAGVSPTEYTTLTVTEERADGNPASSGRRVLVGKVQS
jgi:hypothetical protein